MRIIASVDRRNGGPIQMVHSTEAIHRSMNVDTDVLCLDSKSDLEEIEIGSLRVIPMGPGKWGWAYNKKLLPWLIDNLGHYNAVIIHGLWLYPSHAATRAIRTLQKRGMPTPVMFVFPHGMLDPWFQSGFRRPFKTIRNFVYWLFIERHVIQTADRILFTSKQEQMLAHGTFPFYQSQTESVIPYGSTPPNEYSSSMQEAFHSKCPPAVKNGPYWLFMSRIHPKKGIDLLIKSYQTLCDKFQNTDNPPPSLVIAGPGLDTDYGSYLKNLIRSKDSTIYFCDMLQNEAKWGALYGCAGFFLPSHQENFGIVVAEALSCGKRVYLSNQVNIHQEIVDAGVGISEENNQPGINRLMLKAYQERLIEERTADDTNAKQFFHSHLDASQTAKKLIELIHES